MSFISCMALVLRWWQTRTQCCGHIVAVTNVSPFSRARNICCGHKFCVRDTKNVSVFFHKHFVSATNVSPFVRHEKEKTKKQMFCVPLVIMGMGGGEGEFF